MGGPVKSVRLPTFETFLAETTLRSKFAGISVVAGRGLLLTRIDQALRSYDEQCRSSGGWARQDVKKLRLQELLNACKAWLQDPKKAKKTTQNHQSRKTAVERLAQCAWDEYKLQIYEGRKKEPSSQLATGGMAGVYAKERTLLDKNNRTAISLTTAKATLSDPKEAMDVDPAALDPAFKKNFDQLTVEDLKSLIRKYGERLIENQESPYVAYLSKGQRIHYAMVVIESGHFYCDFTTPFSTVEVASKSEAGHDASGKVVRRSLMKWEIGLNRWVYALDGYGNLFALSPDVFKGGGTDQALPAVQRAGATQLKDHFGDGTRVNHSTFLAGKEVACAGEIVVDDGKLLYVSNASGHYAPSPESLKHLLRYFADEGVDLSEVVVGIATKDSIVHKRAAELLT